MKIRGYYEIRAGDNVYSNHNMITLQGESFFLNRAINEEFEPIKNIVFGDSTVPARKNDESLGHKTYSSRCASNVNLALKRIILSCSVPSLNILGVNEIGVDNGKILISHDVFDKRIDDSFLTNDVDNVEVKYIFDLSTAFSQKEWKEYEAPSTSVGTIYFCYVDDEVTGVSEENTNSGYHRVDERSDLFDANSNGCYYYDTVTGTLYIKTLTGVAPNELAHNILIYTK